MDEMSESLKKAGISKWLRTAKKGTILAGFPTVSALLIVFGISGMYVADSAEPYIEAGNEIINHVPEVTTFADTGVLKLYSSEDPLGRPTYAYFNVTNITINSVMYVSFDVKPGWLVHPPGEEMVFPVNSFIFDEYNLSLYLGGNESAGYISKSYDNAGQMYGIAPWNGTFYVLFDNSKETPVRNLLYKTVEYNVRAYIPEHTERIPRKPEPGEHKLTETIS